VSVTLFVCLLVYWQDYWTAVIAIVIIIDKRNDNMQFVCY